MNFAKTVPVQTLVIDNIQTIDLETPHTIETEINQIETDSIKITDHETTQTMNQTTIDQITITITSDQVTILKLEIRNIIIDKEIFFVNHRTEIIHNIKIHTKTIEVVHQNIKVKLTKYNQLKKLNQTLPALITQTTELQLNHVTCKSTDNETETENILSINMLQVENEYETPIESNYYQNNQDSFQNPDNIQELINYTEQELKGSSSTNNIYQNASNKVQLPKEKIWTIPLLLESPKKKIYNHQISKLIFL